MQQAAVNEYLTVNIVPSLRTVAATRICTALYLRDNLIEFLGKQKNLTAIDPKLWKEQKRIVAGLISFLNLPEWMKRKIVSFNDDIGNELFNWMKANYWIQFRPDYGKQNGTFSLALYDYLKNCLVWSGRGTILYERTARKILQSDFITKEEEFHLSCSYCFFDILNYSFISELSGYRSFKEFEEFNEDPFARYWAHRFFPDNMIRSDLGLSVTENIDAHMLLRANNDVAKKYLFDRLDLIQKERVINIVFNRSDFRMKIYLLSQISAGMCEQMFTDPNIFLGNITNILWQDYILFYFNVYGPYITSQQCRNVIRGLSICSSIHTTPDEEIPDNGWKKLLVNELWNCISEDCRRSAIIQTLHELSACYETFYTIYRNNPLLPQILAILLQFSSSRQLIDEILTIAKDETAKLEISNNIPVDLRYFSIDDESYKRVTYYPRKNSNLHNSFIRQRSRINRRLYLVHEMMSLKTFYDISPLKNELIQNDVIDVFVEYCRAGELASIDEILSYHFPVTSEKAAYKSSLLNTMFHKLLTKAVNESYYYFRTPYNNPRPDRGAGLFGMRRIRQIMDPAAGIVVVRNPNGNLLERLALRRFGAEHVREFRQRLVLPIVHRPRDRPRLAENINDLVLQSRMRLFAPAAEGLDRPRLDILRPSADEGPDQPRVEILMPPIIREDYFNQMLSESPVIYENSDIVFTAVDSFLEWYFTSAEQIDQFKTDTVYSECVPIIESLLSENKIVKLKKVLRWFLSYDLDKINTFKNTSRRHDLTSIL